jgi:hypothetical protein
LETHPNYVDFSSVVCDIISIISHGVRVEASFSLDQDTIGWRQSKPTSETLCEKVIVRQFAQSNNQILAGADAELDTTSSGNNSEMK